VAILLTYGAARVLLAGDAEAREEKYMAYGLYMRPITVVRGPVYPQFATTGTRIPTLTF
jgi:beta-lactamase superfamily II metal-dependent hydrolase